MEGKHSACDAGPAPIPDVWLPAIAVHIASFLPSNEVACTLRVLDRASAEQFSNFRTVHLSQQVPRWAFAEYWQNPEACRSLTRKQRKELGGLVAASGDVANLIVAIQAAGCTSAESVLEAAAGSGALGCCKHIAGVLPPSSFALRKALNAAAEGGHRSVCEWCLALGAERTWGAVAAAYRGGHPELAELLRPEGQPSNHEKVGMLWGAAKGRSLEELKGLWAEWPEQLRPNSTVLSAAVGSPTPDWESKAEFLLAKGFTFGPFSARASLSLPPDTALQRLEWMRLRGYAPAAEGFTDAIKAGSPEGVKWMLDAGAPAVPDAMVEHVCTTIPLELVQLLVPRHMAPARLMRLALRAGAQGLPVLRWLVEAYGPEVLDPRTHGPEGPGVDEAWDFGTAASGGCVESMALLHSHSGTSFSASSWAHAARSGSEAALEWLVEQGCPMPANGEPYFRAAANSDARTLRVLRRLGLPWGKSSGAGGAFTLSVRDGADLGTLRWMVAEGCPVDWAAADKAVGCRQCCCAADEPFELEARAWIREEASAAQPGPQTLEASEASLSKEQKRGRK